MVRMDPLKLCRRKELYLMTALSLWLVLRVDATNDVIQEHIETITSPLCRTDRNRYICNDVPNVVPPKITNVEVTGHFYEPSEGSFSDSSWKQVKILYLSSEKLHHLHNHAFQGLNVSELVLEFPFVYSFEEGVFLPLDVLENIEFLLMQNVDTGSIFRALSKPYTVPKLKYLTFNPGSSNPPPVFTITHGLITNLLQNRSIKVVNITNSKINCNMLYLVVNLFVFKVNTLNISGSDITPDRETTISTKYRISAKWHFKTIDMSRSTIFSPFSRQNNSSMRSFTNKSINHLIYTNQILLVENLYVNYFYKQDTIIGPKDGLDFTNDRCYWKSLHFRGNNLIKIEAAWKFNKNNTIYFVDFSENKVEYITPSFAESLVHLKTLIISRNRLFRMLYKKEAVELLKPLRELRYLDVSSNNLSFIPVNMFSTNKKLETLQLGFNEFTTIMWDISPLRNLVLLDLQSNEIQSIEGEDLFRLQTYVKWRRRVPKSHLQLSFHRNPIVCTCRSSVFISWLADFSALNKTLNSYSCIYGDQDLTVDSSIPCKSRKLCYINIVFFGSVSGSLFMLGFIIRFGFWCKKLYKKRKQADVIADFCRRFCAKKLAQTYLIFMDYSDNNNIVNFVKQKIKNTLTQIVRADENIIATLDNVFPGQNDMTEFYNYLDKSCVFVVMMSNELCSCPKSRRKLEVVDSENMPIFPILLEEVDTSNMPENIRYLCNRTTTRAKIMVKKDGTVKFDPDLENICDSIIELAVVSSRKRINIEEKAHAGNDS